MDVVGDACVAHPHFIRAKRWWKPHRGIVGMTARVILAPVPDRYISCSLDYRYYNGNINRDK